MQTTALKKKRTWVGKICLTLFVLFCLDAFFSAGKIAFMFYSTHPDPDVAQGVYTGEIIGSFLVAIAFLIVGLPLGYLTWRTRAK